MEQIEDIASRDSLVELADQEKDLLWSHRSVFSAGGGQRRHDVTCAS